MTFWIILHFVASKSELELHTKLSMEYENELTLSILQSLGYIKQTIKSKNHSTCNR